MTTRVICGDARLELELLGGSPERTVIITDPVWPNAPANSFGVEDPLTLFTEAMRCAPAVARRLVVHLNVRSDPRFLSAVPAEMPFVRVCWLRYAKPAYHGTILNSGDVAYVFGSSEGPPEKTVLPGEVTSTYALGRETLEHPMPRKLEHLRWLIANFTRPTDTVIDPFAGSGTTLLAAEALGRDSIGIEISEDYCSLITSRLDAARRQQRLAGVV